MSSPASTYSADDEAHILAAVGDWLTREVRPQVKHFDHADEYPHAIVQQMKDLGLFSLMANQPPATTSADALVSEKKA